MDTNSDSNTIITSVATLSSNTKNKEDSINSNENNSSPSPTPTPSPTSTATGLRLDFDNGAIDAQGIPNDGILLVVTSRASFPHRHGGRPGPFVQYFILYDVNLFPRNFSG